MDAEETGEPGWPGAAASAAVVQAPLAPGQVAGVIVDNVYQPDGTHTTRIDFTRTADFKEFYECACCLCCARDPPYRVSKTKALLWTKIALLSCWVGYMVYQIADRQMGVSNGIGNVIAFLIAAFMRIDVGHFRRRRFVAG